MQPMRRPALRLALTGTLVLLLLGSGGARGAANDAADVDPALLPVDLTLPTFDGALEGLPTDRWALIEFYASWCPACQQFKPTYEKLSAALRGEPLELPEVWVARVDCATEVRAPPVAPPDRRAAQGAVGLPVVGQRGGCRGLPTLYGVLYHILLSGISFATP